MLNGSVWITEKKYTRRYKGKCDIFVGIEHRLRMEAMEEQFNREGKEEWRLAADAGKNHRCTGQALRIASTFVGRSFCCSRQQS